MDEFFIYFLSIKMKLMCFALMLCVVSGMIGTVGHLHRLSERSRVFPFNRGWFYISLIFAALVLFGFFLFTPDDEFICRHIEGAKPLTCFMPRWGW